MFIENTINDIEFSNFPQSLKISDITGGKVRVKVYVNRTQILDITLNANGGVTIVESFGRLITKYMEMLSVAHAEIKVEFFNGNTLEVSKKWIALYQRDIQIHPASDWLQNNFLTISKIKDIIPATETIFFFNDENIDITDNDAKATIKAYCYDKENVTKETISYAELNEEVLRNDSSHIYKIYSFEVNMFTIAENADVAVEELNAVAVEYKKRRLFYYRTNNDVFLLQYVSSFGYEEIIGISGVTETKISDSRQTALSGGRLIAYDNQQSFYYEFESAWLNQSEIYRAVECLRSNSVSILNGSPIAISKMEIEVSDEKFKAQRVKFTYHRTDRPEPEPDNVIDDNIFSSQYNINFD